MRLLDRSKVELQLQVDSFMAVPGQILRGTLRLRVLEDVQLASAGVKISGREVASVTYQSGKHRARDTRVAKLFSIRLTLVGVYEGPNNLAYRTGDHSFPFEANLPLELLPSYYVSTGSDYAYCSYELKGFLDIKNGFDGSTKMPLFVAPVVSVSQVAAANAEPAVHSQALEVYGCSCCGLCCFCCKHAGEGITMTTTVRPPLVTFDPAVFANTASSVATGGGGNLLSTGMCSSVGVEVRLRNETSGLVKNPSVKLVNRVRFSTGAHASAVTRAVGDPVHLHGEIGSSGEGAMKGTIMFPPMYRLAREMSHSLPLFSFQSRFTTSTYTLRVSIPSHTVDVKDVVTPQVCGIAVADAVELPPNVTYAGAYDHGVVSVCGPVAPPPPPPPLASGGQCGGYPTGGAPCVAQPL